MFERCFSWAMRHGARIMFAVGLLYFFFGILQGVLSAAALGRGSNVIETSTPLILLNGMLGPLATFGLLLFGALVVDRIDRWLSSRGTG